MARKLVNTKEISHDEWLILRKKSIGGSDAGAVMGMNQYVSAITLYADKKGMSKEKETNEAMRLGNDLEEYVAQRFCEATGKKVRRDNFMWMHDEYDFITANVDREIIGENAGLECKTMSGFSKYDLEAGEVPSHYFCQCQHYMLVKGYDRMYLGILVFQKGFYWFTIERDEDFIKQMLQEEVSYWVNHIEANEMPAPDGSDDSLETVYTVYPEVMRDEVNLWQADGKIKKYRELNDLIKNLEKQRDELKAELCFELGDAAVGVGEDYACSWKKQSKTTVDAKLLKAEYPEIYERVKKVSEARVFRTKELKKKEN